MRILIALEDAARALELALELENRHEDWSCRILTSGPAVLKAAWGYEALIVSSSLPGLGGAALLSALHEQERSAPPLTLLWGGVSPWADVCLPAWNINVGLFLESLALCLPRLYPWEKGLERARYFLSGIGLGPHLKGYRYLVWMTAAALGNPALLNAVTLTLYPRAAQAFHTSAAAVERCVRHAIEALWSHGDLNTLEAYFGQTVDPERGKPTNREFLAMAREHCRF